MKNMIILLSLGAVSLVAEAQQSVPVAAPLLKSISATSTAAPDDQSFNFTTAAAPGQLKTTLGGSRWYNYVDLLILFGSDVSNNWGRSFMSQKGEALAYFGATIGYDTVFLASFGQVLDPSTGQFNDPGLAPALGNVIAIQADPYQLDSIRVYGEYRRVKNEVDTLRIAVVYGGGSNTNLPTYRFTGKTASFGYDTVRYAQIIHDTIRNIAGQASATTPTVIVKDIILNAANAGDTVSDPNSNFGGLNMYSVGFPGGVSIPGGAQVAATVTFIPGGNQPNWDSVSTAAGDKYNYWRAWFFTEKTNDFRTYTPGDWNVGATKYHRSFENASWRGFYIPTYAFTGPVWHENALIDFKLTCPTCLYLLDLDVDDVTITDIRAYPNPADQTLNIPVTLNKTTDVTVNLVNVLGEVMASRSLTKASGVAQVTIPTGNLAPGVYVYTVYANGHTVSNRVMIGH